MPNLLSILSPYWNISAILDTAAMYNLVIGKRSNGKTYGTLEYALKRWADSGEQFAYVRRWDRDFTGANGQTLFASLVVNGVISKVTNGDWEGVTYWRRAFYFNKVDKKTGKTIKAKDPFAYAFSINLWEHDKGSSYPKVGTIIFDEFIARDGNYIFDEFVKFMNVVSTIVRDRQGVKIFMLANTVNKYCPYFREMGLKHIKDQAQGTIDLYHAGDSGLTVAVEYCLDNDKSRASKESGSYFAFDNPRLKMITEGTWEIDEYPHAPYKFRPCDILFTYFIEFDEDLIQGDVIDSDGTVWILYHPKTTPLKSEDTDLIFSERYDPRPNWRRKLTGTNPIEKKIYMLHQMEKVFYATNETGESVRNFLIWSGMRSK